MTKPIRRTQAERTEASDDAMFKAAVKLIAREGPDSMTLAKVGKEAGYTGGLVSYRFGSKIGLLKAVSARILDLWRNRVVAQSDVENKGIQGIKMISHFYLQSVKDKSDLMLALFRMMNESYSSYKEVSPYFKEFDLDVRSRIVDIVERGKKSGEIDKTLDSESFAVLYIGMLRGTAMQYFIDGSAVDLKSANKMLDSFCDTLLAKPKTKRK